MHANEQFDAIVIGSGITGGMAAKELTERGLKVLVLERGRYIEHRKDYLHEMTPPWKIPGGGARNKALYARDYPVQSGSYAFDEYTRHYWNNDRENPYQQDEGKPFSWKRASVLGGKSILWGRQSYRWNELDFEANQRDGHGSDWPIRYRDLVPWYSHIERIVGISGNRDGLEILPDGEFLPPMPFNAVDDVFKEKVEASFPDRKVIIARTANASVAIDGRGPCQYRSICQRGCSFGAYFSSLSSTLPAAKKTGRLTVRADSVVEGLDYDPKHQRISGVRVIDAKTGQRLRFTSKIVFLCASTAGSLQILLNSRSERYPNGLANDSGILGHYLMDHSSQMVFGIFPGMQDINPYGRRPTSLYVPRFRNVREGAEPLDFVRGYGYQVMSLRPAWQSAALSHPGFGAAYKSSILKPGPWMVVMGAFGECLPYKENRVLLDEKNPDRFGIPQVRFSMTWGENERRMAEDMRTQGRAMLKAMGTVGMFNSTAMSTPGDAIHEMGGARMGSDPGSSVTNVHNQAHGIPNLFVTDGSVMASSSCVNPSMTFLALTARAADYAVTRLKAGTI
ncbi:MAG: GMC family oxidoreductase [Proteobacteria bacterium]|nr:GMC family oxidoreductase [Pseudomonadota bacterium]HQR03333.1 GMC family oxidoreductase [Rhodocyclaceae bacterium]